MKFICSCGNTIIDQTDNLSYKAYSYPDESMESFFAALDRLMRSPSPKTELQRDRMMDDVVQPKWGRQMCQCVHCGRLYIESDAGGFCCFEPENEDCPKDLFRGAGNQT